MCECVSFSRVLELQNQPPRLMSTPDEEEEGKSEKGEGERKVTKEREEGIGK